VRRDGTVLPAPDKAWQDLRTLPSRYQGYYPCTAGHPYHAAVSGLFAFSPREFDQTEADHVVFRAMFGPGCDRAARAWSDAFMWFQVWLAQTAGNPLTEVQIGGARDRLAQWRAYSNDVRACAAPGHSFLEPALLQTALARMKEAEDSAERFVSNRSPQPPQEGGAR
jgi:hypothetical protein